jgi:hypothetical protein
VEIRAFSHATADLTTPGVRLKENCRINSTFTRSVSVPSLTSSRRRFFAVAGVPLLGTLAGCSSILRNAPPKKGTLRIRARNISESSHEVTIRVYLNAEENATFSATVTLEAPGGAPHTEEFWPNAIEEVKDETPYRVVAIVDGTRYEQRDTTNCVADDGKHGAETIWMSIREDGTKILTDDCPADT